MALLRTRPRLPRQLSGRFLARFRRSTAAAFCGGNDVALLAGGGAFFAALFAALAAAEETIVLEFYIVRDDATGRRLAELLGAAAARGVQVAFLYDYLGSFETPSGFFRDLGAAGVRCLPFNPPPFRRGLSWFDKRDHRKMAVIDGRIAFAGGLNIGDEYAGAGLHPRPWRDVGLRLSGPAATELQRLFAESWREASAAPLPFPLPAPVTAAGGAAVAIVDGGPHHNRSRIRAAFLLGLAGAGTRVCIETPYFVPGPRFIRALLRTARRGVQVQLILPGHSDLPLVQLVNRSSYAALLKGGIEVFERQETILHAKVMAIDGNWAVIGSANLDQRSFHRNFEVSVIVASRDFGAQVQAMFDTELAASRAVALHEHEGRGLLVRLLERLMVPLGWFL